MTTTGDMSNKTRAVIGIEPNRETTDSDLKSLLGVSKVTPVVSAIYENNAILKAEREMLSSNALQIEDDPFVQLNINTLGEANQIIEPTFHPITITGITHANNTLLQAIAAMEVNIDGTGFEIQRKDGEELEDKDDKPVANLKEFFDEPYPGESFVTMRRKLRRDLESTGNAYLEVIRNNSGAIVFLRHMEAKMTRLLRLDQPVAVVRKITRGGKEINAKVLERQRRYVQVVGRSMVRYFKNYGVERKLDASTGKWLANSAEVVALEDKTSTVTNITAQIKPGNEANEVIHFTAIPDVLTPYGVPRWINNLPSALGSRKAEEFNLEFFDHGGLPPAMILIQGGQMDKVSRDALTNYLSGKAKIKQRGIITEIFAASGDLGSAGNVKVSVERFGDERQKDSMFQIYDERCAEHVRIAFRLPPMFLGLSEAYNFATAYTAYMIAEAQVFRPERDEFDEQINLLIMKELGDAKYVYRSKALNVVDVEQKIKGLELSADFMNPTSFIEAMNEIVRTDFVPKEGIDDEVEEARIMEGIKQVVGATEQRNAQKDKITSGSPAQSKSGGTKGKKAGNKTAGGGRVLKVDFDDAIRELADDWANHLTGGLDFEDENVQTMSKLINHLQPPVRKLFDGYVGLKLSSGGFDDDGVAELMSCVGHRHD